jgi:hypothetical protein
LKTKPRLFRLRWGQLLSAKRADIEAPSSAPHQQSHALPLDGYLGPNGAALAATGCIKSEEACPASQPLVESLRTFSLYWQRILRQSRKKGQ